MLPVATVLIPQWQAQLHPVLQLPYPILKALMEPGPFLLLYPVGHKALKQEISSGIKTIIPPVGREVAAAPVRMDIPEVEPIIMHGLTHMMQIRQVVTENLFHQQ